MTLLTDQRVTTTFTAPNPTVETAGSVRTQVPRVLAIGGTDPSGGAGIHADLKAIAATGGYGMAVVTALVAQNTTGVRSMHVPPSSFLVDQLEAISCDVEIDAIKIGMLFNQDIIAAVGEWLRSTTHGPVVLDPVMISTSGDRLLDLDAEDALRGLLSLADLVTPNVPELAALLNEPVAQDWDGVLDQAQRLAQRYSISVLAKGGHLTDSPDAQDALVDGATGTMTPFSCERIDTKNTHGTGCSLSSAVATLRVTAGSWAPAIGTAKDWLTQSIRGADALNVGTGSGPISHFNQLWLQGAPCPTLSPEEVAQSWWDDIEAIRTGIDDLAFIRGLTSGTLSQEAFNWYLAQDALYLRDYSRALAQASALAPTAAEQAFWASSAHGAIATEIELHGQWLTSDKLFDAEPSATTNAYVNHLLATAARGSYSELIAALLPCFWIYYDVGSRLVQHATADNPFAPWLLTYADPAFEAATREAIGVVSQHAADVDDATRSRMQQAFVLAAQAELEFFAAPLTTSHQ